MTVLQNQKNTHNRRHYLLLKLVKYELYDDIILESQNLCHSLGNPWFDDFQVHFVHVHLRIEQTTHRINTHKLTWNTGHIDRWNHSDGNSCQKINSLAVTQILGQSTHRSAKYLPSVKWLAYTKKLSGGTRTFLSRHSANFSCLSSFFCLLLKRLSCSALVPYNIHNQILHWIDRLVWSQLHASTHTKVVKFA